MRKNYYIYFLFEIIALYINLIIQIHISLIIFKNDLIKSILDNILYLILF